MDRTLLIVGGGFIGSAVARAAAAEHRHQHVVVLGRRTPVEDAGPAEVLYGDARAEDLGLDARRAANLREADLDIVIAAGRVGFDTGLAAAAADAVEPVVNVLRFATSCASLRSVVLVSSIFAVGSTDGLVRSDRLPPRGHHQNFYEWAKQEAERAARASSLPVAIIRPGHVLNATDGSGCAPAPTGIFEALPVLAAGWPLPCDPSTRYWVTPVDVVARAVLALSRRRPAVRSTWCVHPRSPTLGQMLDVLAMRHGLGVKRIRSRRFGPLAAGVLRPSWLGLDVPRQLLAYLHSDLRLDLSCQEALGREEGVDLAPDLAFVTDTIDHEVQRGSALQ